MGLHSLQLPLCPALHIFRVMCFKNTCSGFCQCSSDRCVYKPVKFILTTLFICIHIYCAHSPFKENSVFCFCTQCWANLTNFLQKQCENKCLKHIPICLFLMPSLCLEGLRYFFPQLRFEKCFCYLNYFAALSKVNKRPVEDAMSYLMQQPDRSEAVAALFEARSEAEHVFHTGTYTHRYARIQYIALINI